MMLRTNVGGQKGEKSRPRPGSPRLSAPGAFLRPIGLNGFVSGGINTTTNNRINLALLTDGVHSHTAALMPPQYQIAAQPTIQTVPLMLPVNTASLPGTGDPSIMNNRIIQQQWWAIPNMNQSLNLPATLDFNRSYTPSTATIEGTRDALQISTAFTQQFDVRKDEITVELNELHSHIDEFASISQRIEVIIPNDSMEDIKEKEEEEEEVEGMITASQSGGSAVSIKSESSYVSSNDDSGDDSSTIIIEFGCKARGSVPLEEFSSTSDDNNTTPEPTTPMVSVEGSRLDDIINEPWVDDYYTLLPSEGDALLRSHGLNTDAPIFIPHMSDDSFDTDTDVDSTQNDSLLSMESQTTTESTIDPLTLGIPLSKAAAAVINNDKEEEQQQQMEEEEEGSKPVSEVSSPAVGSRAAVRIPASDILPKSTVSKDKNIEQTYVHIKEMSYSHSSRRSDKSRASLSRGVSFASHLEAHLGDVIDQELVEINQSWEESGLYLPLPQGVSVMDISEEYDFGYIDSEDTITDEEYTIETSSDKHDTSVSVGGIDGLDPVAKVMDHVIKQERNHLKETREQKIFEQHIEMVNREMIENRRLRNRGSLMNNININTNILPMTTIELLVDWIKVGTSMIRNLETQQCLMLTSVTSAASNTLKDDDQSSIGPQTSDGSSSMVMSLPSLKSVRTINSTNNLMISPDRSSIGSSVLSVNSDNSNASSVLTTPVWQGSVNLSELTKSSSTSSSVTSSMDHSSHGYNCFDSLSSQIRHNISFLKDWIKQANERQLYCASHLEFQFSMILASVNLDWQLDMDDEMDIDASSVISNGGGSSVSIGEWIDVLEQIVQVMSNEVTHMLEWKQEVLTEMSVYSRDNREFRVDAGGGSCGGMSSNNSSVLLLMDNDERCMIKASDSGDSPCFLSPITASLSAKQKDGSMVCKEESKVHKSHHHSRHSSHKKKKHRHRRSKSSVTCVATAPTSCSIVFTPASSSSSSM